MFEQVEVNSERWFDLTPLKNEEFRDIKGYEGLYQVSNYGRVKRMKFINNMANFSKPRIKRCYNNGNGYLQVEMCKNGKAMRKYIHILVAQTFISKKFFKCLPYENKQQIDLNKLEVNHRNEILSNNCIDNLEWCTSKYNANYGSRNLRMKKSKRMKSKKINRYDLDNNYIDSMFVYEAIKLNKVHYASLKKCCDGIYKSCGGYIWRYANE